MLSILHQRAVNLVEEHIVWIMIMTQCYGAECQVIKKEQTRQERAALGEGWISLYHQLLLLRKPIIFDRLVGRVG